MRVRIVRKKPLDVQATQLTPETLKDIKGWCGAKYWSRPHMRAITGLIIHTLEGDHIAEYGDWIIRGVRGEFYPIKADIFAETYDFTD